MMNDKGFREGFNPSIYFLLMNHGSVNVLKRVIPTGDSVDKPLMPNFKYCIHFTVETPEIILYDSLWGGQTYSDEVRAKKRGVWVLNQMSLGKWGLEA